MNYQVNVKQFTFNSVSFRLNQGDVKDGLYFAPVHMLCHKGEAFCPDDNGNYEDGWG